MKVKPVTAAAFEQAMNAAARKNFWQTPMMARMQESQGRTAEFLGVFEGDDLKGLSLAVYYPWHFGKKTVYMPRGPVFLDKTSITEQMRAYVQYLKTNGAVSLRIDPYVCYQKHDRDGKLIKTEEPDFLNDMKNAGGIHQGFFAGIDNHFEPQWIYIVPVNDDMEKSYERKVMRNIRHASDSGVQVRELGRDELDSVNEILDETGERKGFHWKDSDYNIRVYDSFVINGGAKFLAAEMDIDQYISELEKARAGKQEEIAKIDPNSSSKKMKNRLIQLNEALNAIDKRLSEAEDLERKKTIIAAGIYFTAGDEVLCLMSGARTKYQSFCGLYAMHNYMIDYARQNQKERFNFYGISGSFDPDAIDRGVYDFKRGFGGEIWHLPGDFVFEVSPLWTKVNKAVHKIRG